MNARGHMEVGGCDLPELATAHGTPLYVYDEETIRQRSREYMRSMGDRGEVLYSAKAYGSPAFLQLVAGEGLGLDVVSAGELHAGLSAGYAGDRIHFLGNNKSREDLDAAYRAGTTLVIDGFHEFDMLQSVVAPSRRMVCEIRVSPGVEPATHGFIATGQVDSKFGFSIESGAAREAVERALAHDRIDLIGLHSHIGSQIFDLRAHVAAMEAMLDLVALLNREIAYQPQRLTAGGGLGIAYTREDAPPTPREFVTTLLAALDQGVARRGLRTPALVVEPGRSIAGPAGVALYSVGSIKDIPGVRRYVAVDGGMGDNIRPKLYGARYEAFMASDPEAEPVQPVTIAGKYCESTDILIESALLPEVTTGDVVCVPAAGAYCLSMASNYNGMPRPEAVLVADGRAKVIRRRETPADLLAAEVF